MEESDDVVENLNILQQEDGAMNLNNRHDSHPTKTKVSAFKSRVFQLLSLFVEKAKNLDPLMPHISQDAFIKDPSRLRQLIIKVVNRSVIMPEDILKFATYYKKLLLFKNKKENSKYGEDFVQILKKLRQSNEEAAKYIIQQMLEVLILRRKCKLSAQYFSYLLKKLPWLKQSVLQKGNELKDNEQVRPAQMRLLQKLLNNLMKGKRVKEEYQQE